MEQTKRFCCNLPQRGNFYAKYLRSSKYRILSGSALKLIAIITMFIDHIGYSLCHAIPFFTVPLFTALGETVTFYYILRKIGRLAFPIYCFLIGEGLRHTRNRRNYLLRLLAFAIISEVPFNLMVGGKLLWNANQNVFFTLFFGALSICFLETVKAKLPTVLLILAVLITSLYWKADYGVEGVVIIVLIYMLRDYPIVQAMAGYPLFSGGFAAVAAFIPINMYNGQRGFIKSPILKYAFYLFYPLHMLLLVAIKRYLTQ